MKKERVLKRQSITVKIGTTEVFKRSDIALKKNIWYNFLRIVYFMERKFQNGVL